MRLAVVTDVHGSKDGLRAVLRHAARLGVDGVISMGDVLECLVSKHDVEHYHYRRLEDVFEPDAELAAMLATAEVVRGNQEERISALVPGYDLPGWAHWLLAAPLEHRTTFGTYCHGHPGPWREVEPGRWCLMDAQVNGRALFHGHHHRSEIYRLPRRGRSWASTQVIGFRYGEPVRLDTDSQYLVNVGPVRGPEPAWALVDESEGTVTFHRATKREAG